MSDGLFGLKVCHEKMYCRLYVQLRNRNIIYNYTFENSNVFDLCNYKPPKDAFIITLRIFSMSVLCYQSLVNITFS